MKNWLPNLYLMQKVTLHHHGTLSLPGRASIMQQWYTCRELHQLRFGVLALVQSSLPELPADKQETGSDVQRFLSNTIVIFKTCILSLPIKPGASGTCVGYVLLSTVSVRLLTLSSHICHLFPTAFCAQPGCSSALY
jgi:hypothetical protein